MNAIGKNIVVIAGLAIACFALWYFSNIVIYIIIAALISLLGEPVKNAYKKISIKKRSLSDSLAALLTVVTFIIALLLIVALFIPLVIKEARIISSINSQDVLYSFQRPISVLENFLASFNVTGDNKINITEKISTAVSSFLSFANLSSFANSIAGTIGNIVVGFFSVLFMAFFFLKEKGLLPNFVLMLTPEKHTGAIKKIMNRSKEILRRYFLALLIQSLFVSIIVFVGLSIVGVDNALIISVLSGILNVIPYIGPLIAGFIGLIIGVSVNIQLDFYSALLPFSLKIIAVFSVVQFIDNFFLQPYIFSNTVNAHPLEIFIVILIAGTIAGISGMIVAIPAYSVLRIIAVEFFSNFKFIRGISDKENNFQK